MTENNEKSRYIIECDNLVKIYKTPDIEVLALQGLDLTVEYGEMTAIIGNSGSGKSTLLNMLGGLDRPSAGKLIVDGKDLFKLSDKELVKYKQQTVGFVWQNNARNLLPYLTAVQNVMMPMLFSGEEKKRQRAEMLLDMVRLSHRKNAKLSTLSGGEQQRIAIAIALSNHPRLLLADEPTGSVDQKTSDYILDMLRDINKSSGVTIVIVTHDQLLAKKVSRVVAIRDGKISSERIMKESYLKRLSDISNETSVEQVQDEYVVMDRAGRIQLPSDMLKTLGVTSNRLQMEMKNGEIVIRKPQEE
ncbi:MAG: ABC transporter ATP-binding protein [Clostridia bacterium]|nr:ABC transporter ATP-binding protein [Clostridia bacterium]